LPGLRRGTVLEAELAVGGERARQGADGERSNLPDFDQLEPPSSAFFR